MRSEQARLMHRGSRPPRHRGQTRHPPERVVDGERRRVVASRDQLGVVHVSLPGDKGRFPVLVESAWGQKIASVRRDTDTRVGLHAVGARRVDNAGASVPGVLFLESEAGQLACKVRNGTVPLSRHQRLHLQPRPDPTELVAIGIMNRAM